MKHDTETALIQAIADGIMTEPCELKIQAAGHYGHGTRHISVDFGHLDAGPFIGAAGATKLAVQTILACPFGADACHIVVQSTRHTTPLEFGEPVDGLKAIHRIMEAIKRHYQPHPFRFHVETSDRAIVVLAEAPQLYTDVLRVSLPRIIRTVAKRHKTIGLLSIERLEETNLAR